MNLSQRWLSDFVKVDCPPREYAHRLTMSGSKVEGYEIEGEEITNVVVGRILSVEKHPDADKLVVCQVEVGRDEPVQIVTGATNVFAGALVPVALDGSTLPGGVKIKKGKLRGIVSNGMMCSVSELNVTVNDFPGAIEDGILIIDEDCTPGEDIRTALGLDDTVVEFEITSNRPDCLSVIGLARETAATFGLPLTLHEPAVKGNEGDIHEMLQVEILNPKLCSRYTAKMVKNIKIEPSPRWLRERLRASGVRPINNIVDITNYVMLEYGQPMHAFDHKYVNGAKINVRNAAEGEKIMTLDGIERTLSPEMLVIADEKAPVAVAGIMGGEFSGIMDDTNTIVFESACFSGSSVRTTAKKLGMRTESSSRFEKGLDPHMTVPAVLRACELVEMLGAGEVVGGIIDIKGEIPEPTKLMLDAGWINRFLGIDISKEEMVKILEKIGFTVEGDVITVPTFRADVEHKADVAEEIARFYGYDKIPVTAIKGTAEGRLTETQKFERLARETMLSLGAYEINTYSFISPKLYDKAMLPADSQLRNSVVISNPLGEDTSLMRTTTIPSMLDTLSRNYNNRNLEAAMFEIGNRYLPVEGEALPDERQQVTIGLYGRDADFFLLKGMVETLLDRLNAKEYDVQPDSGNPTFHPGRCASIYIDGQLVGVMGEVHPLVLQNFEIGVKAYAAELDLRTLFANRAAEKQYKPLPKYPATTRDLALVCDEDVPVAKLQKAIRQASGKILESIEMFDIYRGKQIPDGKKSIAYKISLRASDRTLTDEETNGAMKKILKALADIDVTLRS
ncbi:phenylalanine--tRNA ligase subunit beta [Candidatus Soleaferrea massiliensis]|uniref:phenylalanine--tRNA ligase subunit beta n=1 Tax=Candidatus Soleaferrea massiliensis TaxID=1470354 RepID=UPI00058C5988|nr:phenylalanine--tRNA ligase subunit beta [Candidatus Soleaferrea massiliensis]